MADRVVRGGALYRSDAKQWSKDIAESEVFVTSLDRSSLGVFAAPLDVFAAVEKSRRLAAKYIGDSESAKFRDAVDAEAYNAASKDSLLFLSVSSEVYFWWRLSKNPIWKRVTNDGEGFVFNTMSDLDSVYAHPEMHDYFSAGVWDIAFISRCIADGVDAELAFTLLPDRKAIR